jgi:hypothetical protein
VPAYPLDLHRPLTTQGDASAGVSDQRSPDAALPGPSIRVDSAVAGLWSREALALGGEDGSDDDDDLQRMVVDIEAATSAAEARRSRSGSGSMHAKGSRTNDNGAKRKKYTLDSSDPEDNEAYLQARRAAATGKARAKTLAEPKRVKGKGKERSATVDASDDGEMRAVSVEPPPPKRKRKTADEIVCAAPGPASQHRADLCPRRPLTPRSKHGRARTRPRKRRVARCVLLWSRRVGRFVGS